MIDLPPLPIEGDHTRPGQGLDQNTLLFLSL